MMEVLIKGNEKRPEEKVCFLIPMVRFHADSLVADSDYLAMDWLPLSFVRLLDRERYHPRQVSHAHRLHRTNSNFPSDIKVT